MTFLIKGIRPRALLSFISLLAGIFIHSAAFAESRLILLGNFPAVEEGQADALSDDGTVVVGESHYLEDGAFVEVAFRRSDITATGLGWLTESPIHRGAAGNLKKMSGFSVNVVN